MTVQMFLNNRASVASLVIKLLLILTIIFLLDYLLIVKNICIITNNGVQLKRLTIL